MEKKFETYADLSDLCPICDQPLPTSSSWYGDVSCKEGHYYTDCGNYHTAVYINGKEAAFFDDCFNEGQDEKLAKAIKEAREEWQKKIT